MNELAAKLLEAVGEEAAELIVDAIKTGQFTPPRVVDILKRELTVLSDEEMRAKLEAQEKNR